MSENLLALDLRQLISEIDSITVKYVLSDHYPFTPCAMFRKTYSDEKDVYLVTRKLYV